MIKFKEIKTREEFIDVLPVMMEYPGDTKNKKTKIDNFILASSKGYRLFAAYKSGKAVAVAGIVVVYSPNYSGPAYDINHISVANDYKQKGIGSKFLDFLKKITLEEGGSCLRLATYTENYPVLAFYQKNGFKHTANFMFYDLEKKNA